MVLRKVLEQLQPVSEGAISDESRRWSNLVEIRAGNDVPWSHQWEGDTAARHCFEEGWRLFEVIRLYRQFGTAQAIGWVLNYLGGGLLDGLARDDETEWRHMLGAAFADTLADQLQILFSDEIEVLLTFLRTPDATSFTREYNAVLGKLTSLKRRSAQVLALQSIKDPQGQPYLSFDEARAIATHETQSIDESVLNALFHADQPRGRLPQLEERLERFLFERII
jgi:hypothetical protein